ncbi:AzlC family ABC transporter permease [Ramlibacter tataouinensis]|uniref:Candidate branched chain amino acid permease, azaleucine resistance n=1 Tax=Ramlibacter tataouinensis (strain ATCC BAA-407 / DSM 14655 / LMG 21543 / TTB310) TaxID=365046 RepID=F5XWD8_RAMTT|nr:AzlC family ABC transporter permease [Ramlibacter tataouinensis]AEG92892.1 Candidate branched chain amino acid permease, azaleucine resistance [Ramlibacter tataouinensis TTB310]
MTAAPVSFTRAGVWRGFVLAQPLAPGVALYGLVFGVLAGERGLSWLQALLMSVFVYSGSAQLAALEVWASASGLAALLLTILAINARYVLYGAALQPWLAPLPRRHALGSLFLLGDGSWVLSMREWERGERDAGFVLGSGLAGLLPWLGGTVAGHLLTSGLPDPRAWGLDFMLPAFAAAIAISVWRGRGDLAVLAVAGVTALLLHRLVPGGWYIVGAGLAAGAMGAWRHGR